MLGWSHPAQAQVRSIDYRIMREPPFRHTFARKAPPVTGAVVVVPVRPYEGVGSSPVFDGDTGLAAIAQAIDARVATMPQLRRVAGPQLGAAHWPGVTLGDEELATGAPREAGNRRIALAVTNPSRDWKRAMQPLLEQAEADHTLVINVSLAEVYLRQDWLGRTSLPIGTDYVVPVAWMNDLESTVGVLVLSGALYDRSGKLIRAASEGILAGEPTFWQGVVAKTITGGRGRITTIGEADNPEVVLRTHRRTELPGAPLAWEVALDHLLRHLLQREGV
jgi:hypothetical protein